MKTLILSLTVLAALALLISCPEPLTEDVVMAAEDNLVPTISVISPTGSDPYYSEVEFNLEISDDAKSEGDGKGDIASIEFSVSNDDFRGGKIDISDGTVTQDDSAGPDEISFDSNSGICSFSFSTVDPNPLSGYISVTVKATDRNGNETEEKISLTESEGPWVEYTLVDGDGTENMYVAGESVYLSGTVGNSTDNSDSDSEIYSINWTLAGSYYEGTLILDEDATYEDPYNGNAVTSYYIESENLYRRSVDVLVGTQDSIAQPFEYDPTTRTFQVNGIWMYSSLKDSGAITLNLVVTDKNGHETESSVLVSENTLGPVIVPNPVNDASYSHFSTDVGYCEPVTGEMNASTGTLSSFSYSLYYGSESVTDIDIPMGAGNDFSIDYYSNLQSIIDATDLGTTAASGTTVNIEFEAAYDDGRSSSVLGTIALDNDAPDISGFSFKSDHGDDGKYANENSTVTYLLTVSDDMGLIDDNELTIDIIGPAMTDSTTTTDASGDVILTYSVGDWCAPADSDANIPYTITVSDRLGNSETYIYANGDFDSYVNNTVMYYDSTVSVLGIATISLQAPNEYDNIGYAKADDLVTLTLTSTRDLTTPDLATIDGVNDTSVTKVSDTEFTASVAQNQDNVENRLMSVNVPFTDKAGNDYTAITTADEVYYDSVEPVLTAGLSSSISGTGVVDTGSDYYLNENMNNVYITVDGLAVGTQDANLEGLKLSTFNDSSFGDVQSLVEPSTEITVQLEDIATLTSKDDGGYTAYVQLVDKAGNVSESNYEVPFYIDTEDPTLTLVEFMSNNSTNDTANTDYAKLNDHVWVTFTATDENGMDNVNGYTITINDVLIDGVVANTTYDESDITSGSETGTQNTCTLTLVSDEVDKTIPFSIEVKDNAGNTATLTQDDTASTVTYYSRSLDENYIDLEFSTAGGNKDGDDNCYAASGENFSLNLATTRDLEAISGTFNGASISNAALDGSVSVPGSCSFSDSRSDETEEEISFDFTGLYALTDKAGNEWSVSALPSGVKLYYDNVAPSVGNITLSMGGTGYYDSGTVDYFNMNSDSSEYIRISYSLLSDVDPYLNGCSYDLDYDGSSANYGSLQSIDDDISVSTATDGSFTAIIKLEDYAGNDSTTTVDYSVDTDPPDFSSVTMTPDGSSPAYVLDGSTHYFNSGIDSTTDLNSLDVTGISTDAGDHEDITYSITNSSGVDLAGYSGVDLGESSSTASIPVDDALDGAGDDTYTVSIEAVDAAGNTSTESIDVVLDTTVDISYETAMSGEGGHKDTASGNLYINAAADDSGTDDVAIEFSNVDTDCIKYKSKVEGNPDFGSETDISGNAFSVNVSDLEDSTEEGHTVSVIFYDAAGNISPEENVTVTLDKTSPAISASGVVTNTSITFTFSDTSGSGLSETSFNAAGFSLGIPGGDTVEVSAAVASYPSVTFNSTLNSSLVMTYFTEGNVYTLQLSSAVSDLAGNESASSYDFTYASSGIGPSGSLDLTYTPDGDDDADSSDSSGSSGSYKTRSDQMTAELRTVEEVEEQVALSTEMKSEIQDEMRSVKKVRTVSPGSGTVQRASARIVERPDLNTGMEALSRAMEQVEKNKADYKAMLDDLRPEELGMTEMLAMSMALEPEIYEPLTMTVSASPLVSGAAGEIEVSLHADPDEAMDEKTGRYVALKALIALMGVMVTALFLYLMRRLQKK